MKIKLFASQDVAPLKLHGCTGNAESQFLESERVFLESETAAKIGNRTSGDFVGWLAFRVPAERLQFFANLSARPLPFGHPESAVKPELIEHLPLPRWQNEFRLQ